VDDIFYAYRSAPEGARTVDIVEKTLTYETQHTCKRNSVYPIVRLLCGEIHRIADPKSVPERFSHGEWRTLANLK